MSCIVSQVRPSDPCVTIKVFSMEETKLRYNLSESSVRSSDSLRYIFTVTTGRSGQAAFADLLNKSVPDCYAAFEEPFVKTHAQGVLGGWERRFRRRFIETHELLGRGKVLKAYSSGDEEYIESIARKRQQMIEKKMERVGKSIYIDVSKFFARGLHAGWKRVLPSFSLVRLVRDPVLNMRSFLNRNKTFTLDNNLPSSPTNLLVLDADDLSPGELYLWSWCETYLQFDAMVDRHNIQRAVEVRTEHLGDPNIMSAVLDGLGLAHEGLEPAQFVNTNQEVGNKATVPTAEDILLFEHFINRIPTHIRRRISYFDAYSPMT